MIALLSAHFLNFRQQFLAKLLESKNIFRTKKLNYGIKMKRKKFMIKCFCSGKSQWFLVL